MIFTAVSFGFMLEGYFNPQIRGGLSPRKV